MIVDEAVARPEVEPKTPLAQRIRLVRSALGDPERDEFAQRIGASKSTIANYERGDRVPDADILALYRDRAGVDLNWLVTGEGTMFRGGDTRVRIPTKGGSPLDTDRLERAIALIESGLDEAGRAASPSVKAGMVSAAYEILSEAREEVAEGRILRLVKG